VGNRCISCGGGLFLPLIRFANVPVSGAYLDDPAALLPRADVALVYCTGCGFASKVYNAGGGPDYAAIDRGTAQQMPEYAAQLLTSMRQAGIESSTEIVEAGSNDGSFLELLAANGFRALRGIEPSQSLASVAAEKGFKIENGYCTTASASALVDSCGPFGAVVCRHTLEHVPDPSDLLCAIGRLLAPDGVALIEVPDFDWVIETLAVHEIWDEHVSYFSRGNLVAALSAHGFDVISCEQIHLRDTRNLVALARWKGRVPNQPMAANAGGASVAGCRNLDARWQDVKAKLALDSRGWRKPVLAIGASHIQTNFIHFAGLAGVVDALIDDDPRKAGKFVMLDRARPVVSTQSVLGRMHEGTLLRTAFPYPAWMDRICDVLRPDGVRIVDPYGGLSHRTARPD
jgi:SAM-dependent methyltransferase